MIPARARVPLALAALLGAVAVSYGNSVAEAGLVYDDLVLVGRNPYIRDLPGLWQGMTRSFWSFAWTSVSM